jgi:hypothetical protein
MSSSSASFATHEMVKTDIASSKSIRVRARSDVGSVSNRESRRDKFEKPFPVKARPDREDPKNLPPTPPSESEDYSIQRSRSRSQPARTRSTRSSESSSSDYSPPARPRLDTVRDEDGLLEPRRSRSVSGRVRNASDRALERSRSRRDIRGRKDDGDDFYDVYDDYYEEKLPVRSLTTRRPLGRAPSRSRASSSSRGRSREDEDDYGQRYSDEDDEFEMVTTKRTEISKVPLSSFPRLNNH